MCDFPPNTPLSPYALACERRGAHIGRVYEEARPRGLTAYVSPYLHFYSHGTGLPAATHAVPGPSGEASGEGAASHPSIRLLASPRPSASPHHAPSAGGVSATSASALGSGWVGRVSRTQRAPQRSAPSRSFEMESPMCTCGEVRRDEARLAEMESPMCAYLDALRGQAGG